MRKDRLQNRPRGENRKRIRKGYLSAAFAAAAVAGLGGCATTQTLPVQTMVVPAEPATVNAFHAAAVKTPDTAETDFFFGQWNAAWQHQSDMMKIPGDAAGFTAFLKTFDDLRGRPLLEMADRVNARVQAYVAYTSDEKQYNAADYWAAPVETEISHKGDCEDYAILQYAILRYLGVPDSRLFVAAVSSKDRDGSIDHAVLILNIAPAGVPQDFVVLNDAGPVDNSVSYTKPGGANGSWTLPYKFYDAHNKAGFWQTALELKMINSPGRENTVPHVDAAAGKILPAHIFSAKIDPANPQPVRFMPPRRVNQTPRAQ